MQYTTCTTTHSGTIGIFFSHKTETPHPMEKDNDLFSFVKVTPSNSIQWKLVLSLFVELLIGENKLFSWLFCTSITSDF